MPHKMGQHTKSHLLKKTWCTFLIYGYDSGGSTQYAYVRVHGPKLEEFRRAVQEGPFTPAQHGDILAQGSGDPPAELMHHMEKHYQVDHSQMIVLGESKPDQGV